MDQKIKFKVVTWFFCLVFLYLFAIYKIDFFGPDCPIYYSYTASVVENGDLNAVNNQYGNYPYYIPDLEMEISKTYNLADFHNYGGVFLWASFYSYGRFIYFIATKFNIAGITAYSVKKIIKCVMSFSTIVFSFVTLILTYMLCMRFFPGKIALWSVLTVFFGTPFFYYTLIEPANANIIATLFSIISIWFCSYIISARRLSWFIYGLFFSICIVVKVDLWFQIFFIALIFVDGVTSKKIAWRNGLFFLLGLFLGSVLIILNNYIKYGLFHFGEFGVVNFKDNYFFDQLFSVYHGFFYTSPIFYICLLGIVSLIVNLLRKLKSAKLEDKFNIFFFCSLSLYLIIKVIFLGYRYAWGGGTCGARQLLTEFPIFVLLYAWVFQKQKSFFANFLLCAATVFCVFWNMAVIAQYLTKNEFFYVLRDPGFTAKFESLKYLSKLLFYPNGLSLKLKVCMPLLFAVFGIILYVARPLKIITEYFRHENNECNTNFFGNFYLFTLYLFISFTIITFLNISNNKSNVEKLIAEGYFKNVKILAANEFEKKENVGSMNEMIKYFKLRGNIKRVKKIKELKKEIYSDALY